MNNDYQKDLNNKTIIKVRQLLEELPPFCAVYFRGIENSTSPLTRHGYAVDLKIFFNYLCDHLSEFQNLEMRSVSLEMLNSIQAEDIENYLSYIGQYFDGKNEKIIENHEKAKSRKLSTLRAMFKYFYKKNKLSSNVTSLVDTPKIHEKPIIRLEANETADLLDNVENGEKLSKRQKQYHSKTQCRDLAIMAVFLGTGVRISELVGLNISDIDNSAQSFRVTRKGGSQVILYYGDEVASALDEYILQREKIIPFEGNEDALFLSMQRKRITARAVQNLVKKYSQIAVPLKNISPHKLRSTYGTMLYQETGDIYLVADVLGHRDVNTTKRHYAAQSDENRRLAARAVKLRDD